MPIKVERISIVINTTPVDPINSSRVDQVTFCISARTSEMNFLILPHITTTPTFVSSGQEGFEPPTSGFGDRRSSQLELLA